MEQDKVKELTAQLQSKEDELEIVKSSEALCKQEVEKLSSQNKALKEALETGKSAAEAALTEARNQIAAKKDENRLLQESLKKVTAEKERAEEEWAVTLEKRNQVWKASYEDLEQRMDAKVEKLKKEAAEESKKVSDLGRSLREVTSKLTTARNEEAKCKDDGQILRRDLAEATASLKRSQEQIAQNLCEEKKTRVELEKKVENMKQEVERFDSLGERYEKGNTVSKLRCATSVWARSAKNKLYM